MNRLSCLIFCGLLTLNVYSQKREVQATIGYLPSFLSDSKGNLLIETRFEQRLKYAPIWFTGGLEFLSTEVM